MKRSKFRLARVIQVYCLGCYVAFGLFFALTPLWWSAHEMWSQLGRALPIYGLLAPISIPMLVAAPILFAPGPGLHAVIFWVVVAVSFLITDRWIVKRTTEQVWDTH